MYAGKCYSTYDVDCYAINIVVSQLQSLFHDNFPPEKFTKLYNIFVILLDEGFCPNSLFVTVYDDWDSKISKTAPLAGLQVSVNFKMFPLFSKKLEELVTKIYVCGGKSQKISSSPWWENFLTKLFSSPRFSKESFKLLPRKTKESFMTLLLVGQRLGIQLPVEIQAKIFNEVLDLPIDEEV